MGGRHGLGDGQAYSRHKRRGGSGLRGSRDQQSAARWLAGCQRRCTMRRHLLCRETAWAVRVGLVLRRAYGFLADAWSGRVERPFWAQHTLRPAGNCSAPAHCPRRRTSSLRRPVAAVSADAGRLPPYRTAGQVGPPGAPLLQTRGQGPHRCCGGRHAVRPRVHRQSLAGRED